jgi:orotidine-5'-phosphate decarboxylase
MNEPLMRPRADIPVEQRLIFALDVASGDEARAWIDRLGDSVAFYKIGLELLASGDYFQVLDLLAARGKQVFADLKLHDVPATVASAVRGLSRWPIRFCTVHTYQTMLRAAAEVRGDMKLLAVTVLTSMDDEDLRLQGVQQGAQEAVLVRARLGRDAGCDGVIASGREAATIRAALGPDYLIVCPGIRADRDAGRDDQKRTVSVATAFANGADHVVVGRPIRHAANPRAAAEALQQEIVDALETINKQ